MEKILNIGQKSSAEVERGIRLLHSYGYIITKDKGYYEIFDGNVLVGQTKNSPTWIDPIRNFRGELEKDENGKPKNPHLFGIFQTFVRYLDVLEIPYPFGKKGPGIEFLKGIVSRTLEDLSNQ